MKSIGVVEARMLRSAGGDLICMAGLNAGLFAGMIEIAEVDAGEKKKCEGEWAESDVSYVQGWFECRDVQGWEI